MTAPSSVEKKPRRLKKRLLLLLPLLLVLYLVLGALAPFWIQPQVDPQFQASFDLSRFSGTGSPDRAALVITNEDALDQRLRMISEAQERILFSSFDVRDGESGRDIFAALLRAADRGVEIQLLVDGMNGLVSMAAAPMFYVLGSHPNVEIRFYNTPNPFLPWTFNGRMHDKYILVDDRLLLLGGRNTFDKFLGDSVPDSKKSHDLDLLLWNTAAGTPDRSSALFQVEDYFSQIWSGPDTGTWLDHVPFFFRSAADREREALQQRYEVLSTIRPGLFSEEPTDYLPYTVPVEDSDLIYNPIHIFSKEPWVWWQLQQLMEHAQKRVFLQTPYAVCNAPMYDGLATVAAKGIPFQMNLNSVGVGDNFMASSDYVHNKDRVLETGVTLWEWYGDYSSHGKSLLIDDELVAVGSYNLDMRSTYIDTELMLVLRSEALNDQLETYWNGMQASSLQVIDRDSYVPKEGLVPWDNGDWKHHLYPVTSVLFQPFRNLL